MEENKEINVTETENKVEPVKKTRKKSAPAEAKTADEKPVKKRTRTKKNTAETENAPEKDKEENEQLSEETKPAVKRTRKRKKIEEPVEDVSKPVEEIKSEVSVKEEPIDEPKEEKGELKEEPVAEEMENKRVIEEKLPVSEKDCRDEIIKTFKYGTVGLVVIVLLLCGAIINLTNKLNANPDTNIEKDAEQTPQNILTMTCPESGVTLSFEGLENWYMDQSGYVLELNEENGITMIGQILPSYGVVEEDYNGYIQMISEDYPVETLTNVNGYKIRPVEELPDTNYIISDMENQTVFEVFFEGQTEETMNLIESSFKLSKTE